MKHLVTCTSLIGDDGDCLKSVPDLKWWRGGEGRGGGGGRGGRRGEEFRT